MSEKQLAKKTLKDNMVDVHIQLCKPFHDFMKTYLAFFGDNKTIEDLCMIMIYDCVNRLYRELEEFSRDSHRFLDEYVWPRKWPHLACTSIEEDKEEI